MHDISPPAAAAGPATRSSGRYQRARLLMVGLDHNVTDIATREAFSLAEPLQGPFLRRLCAHPHISGCAYLSTCNRSELYLSHTGAPELDAASLLCEALGVDPALKNCLLERAGASAVRHLMRVSGGVGACVPGDDQVITQIRAAIEFAREADSVDPQLETLFRFAVTAGKRIRATLAFSLDGDSAAEAAACSPGGQSEDGQSTRRTLVAEEIVDEEAARFEMWRQNRMSYSRRQRGRPDFPAFINLHDRIVLVAGGGKVAARRTEALLNFGARIRLIAPEVGPEMRRLLDREGLVWRQRHYESSDLDGVILAVAATDARNVNRRIGREAKEQAILVSVADRREECSFYFPAIIRSENLTAGLVSNDGSRHDLVKKAAARLRGALDRIDEDYTGGKQGE